MESLDITKLSLEQLGHLEAIVKNRIYELKNPSPFKNLKFQCYETTDEWKCYEDGESKKFVWLVNEETPIIIRHNNHSSKHTDTVQFSIEYKGKYFAMYEGDYPSNDYTELPHDLHLSNILDDLGEEPTPLNEYKLLVTIVDCYDSIDGQINEYLEENGLDFDKIDE